MAINVNGTPILDVKVNGTSIDTVKVNSTTVYTKIVIKTKQWVFISVSTSQGFYTPFYEISSSSEQATVELMEQKFPARNYNVGHFGEIQWYDNFYVFQVQEV